jgi:hypothetical protein
MIGCKRMNTHISFKTEYQTAQDAQADGLEGRARVCARRAAGILIQKYLETQNINHKNMNSLDLIKHLQQSSDTPELAFLLGYYSETVSSDHHLASDVDLVAKLPLLAHLLNINLLELD